MTKMIATDAIARGKTVYVPFMDTSAKAKAAPRLMDMVSLHSQGDLDRCENNRDKWGIPSVDSDSSSNRNSILASSETSLDIVLLPGLAFDRNCRRLGHGKGFYDGFLTGYENTRISKSEEWTMPY